MRILLVFLCFDHVALSNNVALLPQLRADLTRVLANVRLSKQRVESLHQAAQLGQTQVVEQLLADGVKLKQRNAEGKLAYEVAFAAGHFHLAVLLLKKTEGIDGRSSDGFTPLNIGLALGDAEIVRAAIKDGADIFAGQYNLHALHTAEHMEQEEMLLKALVAENRFGGFGDFGKRDKIFIDWIGKRKLIPVIKEILADPQRVMSATLQAQLAVLADDAASFQQALDADALHQQVWPLVGFSPAMFELVIARLEAGSLHHAAAHGKREALAALLAKGADINTVDQYSWSALDYAVFSGQAETTRILCEADADVCVFDYAKHMLDADTPTVETLRAYASDKHPTAEGWLHYYLRKGQTARAINHIKSYPNPNKLIYIGVRGAENIGQYKHREGIDIDGVRLSVHPDTVLHAAALYGDLELIKYLIETMHMDVNYRSHEPIKSGNTALHMAAIGNHIEVVRYLLARGADVHAKDKGSWRFVDDGFTAAQYAEAYSNLEMARFLAASADDMH